MRLLILVLVGITLAGCKNKVSDYAIKANLPVHTHPTATKAADSKNAYFMTPGQRQACMLLKKGALILTCNEKVRQCKAQTHTSDLIDGCMRKELGDATYRTLQKAYRQERGEKWKEEAGFFGF